MMHLRSFVLTVILLIGLSYAESATYFTKDVSVTVCFLGFNGDGGSAVSLNDDEIKTYFSKLPKEFPTHWGSINELGEPQLINQPASIINVVDFQIIRETNSELITHINQYLSSRRSKDSKHVLADHKEIEGILNNHYQQFAPQLVFYIVNPKLPSTKVHNMTIPIPHIYGECQTGLFWAAPRGHDAGFGWLDVGINGWDLSTVRSGPGAVSDGILPLLGTHLLFNEADELVFMTRTFLPHLAGFVREVVDWYLSRPVIASQNQPLADVSLLLIRLRDEDSPDSLDIGAITATLTDLAPAGVKFAMEVITLHLRISRAPGDDYQRQLGMVFSGDLDVMPDSPLLKETILLEQALWSSLEAVPSYVSRMAEPVLEPVFSTERLTSTFSAILQNKPIIFADSHRLAHYSAYAIVYELPEASPFYFEDWTRAISLPGLPVILGIATNAGLDFTDARCGEQGIHVQFGDATRPVLATLITELYGIMDDSVTANGETGQIAHQYLYQSGRTPFGFFSSHKGVGVPHAAAAERAHTFGNLERIVEAMLPVLSVLGTNMDRHKEALRDALQAAIDWTVPLASNVNISEALVDGVDRMATLNLLEAETHMSVLFERAEKEDYTFLICESPKAKIYRKVTYANFVLFGVVILLFIYLLFFEAQKRLTKKIR